jgi:hypothetical protein
MCFGLFLGGSDFGGTFLSFEVFSSGAPILAGRFCHLRFFPWGVGFWQDVSHNEGKLDGASPRGQLLAARKLLQILVFKTSVVKN